MRMEPENKCVDCLYVRTTKIKWDVNLFPKVKVAAFVLKCQTCHQYYEVDMEKFTVTPRLDLSL